MKPLVIYHGNCQDGFTAAWVVWKQHPEWEFYPAKHGNPPPDVTYRNVYMLDFSYKRPVIEEIIGKAQSLTILDHHKTAEADLKFPFACDPSGMADVQIIFDMEKSGARLAWEYFNPEAATKDRPMLIDYVEDRDLWRFKYPETKAISSFLFSHPYDFSVITAAAEALDNPKYKQRIIGEGNAILRQHDKDVEELIQNKFKYEIAGFPVWVANLPYTLCSDAANVMSRGEAFAATYYYDGEGYIFSLRSDTNGIDVSEVAKLYGGGGHQHASGFKITAPFNPIPLTGQEIK